MLGTRSSKRKRGQTPPDLHGGSIRDGARVPTIATGKRNPDSNTSQFNLRHKQVRNAQERAEKSGYKGPVAASFKGKLVVFAEYCGCWRRENTGPVFHFECNGGWMFGAMHGEGTLKFTHGEDFFKREIGFQKIFKDLGDGDVYEGSWSNNLPHGKGKVTSLHNYEYEGDFVYGVRTGAIIACARY